MSASARWFRYLASTAAAAELIAGEEDEPGPADAGRFVVDQRQGEKMVKPELPERRRAELGRVRNTPAPAATSLYRGLSGEPGSCVMFSCT